MEEVVDDDLDRVRVCCEMKFELVISSEVLASLTDCIREIIIGEQYHEA